MLKQYRESQNQHSDDDIEMSADVYQTEVMRTVQKVITEIQRKYDLATASASHPHNTHENENVLMDVSTIEDQPNTHELMSTEEQVVKTFPETNIQQMTSESVPLPVASTHQGQEIPIPTDKPHVGITDERPDLPSEEAILPDTDPGHSLVVVPAAPHLECTSQTRDETNTKKTRKRIERIREHYIPISEFPKPKEATDEKVEELRLKFDFPPFPKLKEMGHGTIFTEEEESEMKVFLHDCCVLGIPRTADEFKVDVAVYYNLKTKDDPKAKKYVFW